MKNPKTPVRAGLFALSFLALAGSMTGSALAQQYQQPPPYPPQQPAPQYPPQYPPPRPQQPAPQYPPQYPPQPPYPPQPQQPPRPQQPAPQYPPQYPAPQYPPQYPAPQQPAPYPPAPGQPAPYPPPPGQPPQYPAPAPGYPPAAPGYPPAYADPNNPYGAAYGPAPGARQHDGFFLRLMLGPSFQHSSGKVSGLTDVKTTFSGFGMLLDIAVGATVAENFVIYGNIVNHNAFNPTFKAKGPGGETKNELDESINFQGFGAGVAYFFQPMNVHAGGGLHLARLTSEDDDSDVGLGLNVNVGKDWWVSDSWSIGVNGQIMAARITLDIKDGTQSFKNKLNAIAGAVAFVATFN